MLFLMESSKAKNILIIVLACIFTFITSFVDFSTVYAAESDTVWAKSTVTAPDDSIYNGVYIDSNGYIYAVGNISGTGTFNFGNGVTAAGSSSGNNAVLVKYDSGGSAQWAKTTISGANSSSFTGIKIDSSGNIYISGSISGTGTFNFGNSVTVAGGHAAGNGLVIKYNSSGDAQWAKSTVTGPNSSKFNGISIDSSGNSIVVGNLNGSGTFNFGNSVTTAGANASQNAVIIKYDSSGLAQWAKTTSVGPGTSVFNGIATDSSGNSYAAGQIVGSSQFDFGSSITVTGSSSSSNPIVIGYDSSGVPQWAKTTTGGSDSLSFSGISMDSSGNIVAVGEIASIGLYDFGNSVTVTGTNSSGNPIIVKYSASGVAQWAKTTVVGPDYGTFNGISSDSSGNVYAVGEIDGTSQYNFGNGITITGAYSSNNLLVVKYDSGGLAQWAKTTVVGPNNSYYKGVVNDTSGNTYAVGEIYGTSQYDFGSNITVSGAGSFNFVIIKYSGPPAATPTPTPTLSPPGPGDTCTNPSPINAPFISRVSRSGGSATLYFTSVTSNTTGYQVIYGLTPTDERFGVSFSSQSSAGVLTYTINYLSPFQSYYFKIRAVNDCAGGPWSNIFSSFVTTGSPAPTSTPIPTTTPTESTSSAQVQPSPTLSATSLQSTPSSIQTSFSQSNLNNIILIGAVGAGATSAATIVVIIFVIFVTTSNIVLSSLPVVYQTTERSVWKMPFDYVTSVGRGMRSKLSYFLPFIMNNKKTDGVVFDTSNKSPVFAAYIILYSQSGNLKTDFTNQNGNYYLSDIIPDDYMLKVNAKRYAFPSQVINSHQIGGISNIYLNGDLISISKDNNTLSHISVPLDPSR